MRLVALTDFKYRDVSLKIGDTFDSASDEDARKLKGFGKAGDPPEPSGLFELKDERAEGGVAADSQPQRGKRQYRRRDMVSED